MVRKGSKLSDLTNVELLKIVQDQREVERRLSEELGTVRQALNELQDKHATFVAERLAQIESLEYQLGNQQRLNDSLRLDKKDDTIKVLKELLETAVCRS